MSIVSLCDGMWELEVAPHPLNPAHPLSLPPQFSHLLAAFFLGSSLRLIISKAGIIIVPSLQGSRKDQMM